MSSSHPQERSATRVVFVTLTLDLMAFSLIFPLYPAMLDWYLPTFGETGLLADLWALLQSPTTPRLAVTAAFGGILAGIFSLLQFLSARFWGGLADKHGRRPILLLTIAGLALTQLVWVFAANFWVLLASRALAGLFAGNIGVATAVIADVTPPERRARGMAWVGMAFGLGFLLGPAIGGAASLVDFSKMLPAAGNWGLHPFSMAAFIGFALGLVNFVWLWKTLPETRPTEQEKIDSANERGSAFEGLLGKVHPVFLHASRINFLLTFTLSAIEFCITFLAVERLQFSPRDMIAVFVVLSIVMAGVQGGIVRPFAEKVGTFPLLMAGLWCIALANVGLAVAQDTVIFFLALSALAAGIGLVQPTLTALASNYTNREHAARDLGAFRSAGSLGRALGPFAAAAMFWGLGSVLTYGIGGALAMLAALMALFLPKG